MLKIGMEELERARRLQEESAKLHLPSPPVTSFKISRKENNGKIKDLIYAKSNSYVRNAYNLLTQDLTFSSDEVSSATYFGDGTISYQSTAGIIRRTPNRRYSNGELDIDLRLGTNGTPDTLDDTTLDEVPTTDWSGSMDRYSMFDPSSRRFITLITRNMANSSDTTTHEIKESGIYINPSGAYYLAIRDTFPPVIFAPGDSITFTYQLEVYYPPDI